MIRIALALLTAAGALAACGLKTNPTPAPPLWGDPNRAPVSDVFSPESTVIVVDPNDPDIITGGNLEDEFDDPDFDDGDPPAEDE